MSTIIDLASTDSGATSMATINTNFDTLNTDKLGAADTATLTNKTIDADGTGNSITNIENADIKSGAAIDAAKIHDGSVSNTEFGYLNGVSSAIQTQLDAKLPLAGGTMAGNITLGENTAIALDPAGSADGKYSGITVTGTGGAVIAFGDLVTLDVDDSRWEKVDISVAAAATGDARGVLGIAVTASTDGGAITVLLHGIVRADANFPDLTIGAPVYASTTGDIVVAQPTTTDYVIRVIGFGLTANELYFNPDNSYITHT